MLTSHDIRNPFEEPVSFFIFIINRLLLYETLLMRLTFCFLSYLLPACLVFEKKEASHIKSKRLKSFIGFLMAVFKALLHRGLLYAPLILEVEIFIPI